MASGAAPTPAWGATRSAKSEVRTQESELRFLSSAKIIDPFVPLEIDPPYPAVLGSFSLPFVLLSTPFSRRSRTR
jgi:hypothetical protein